MPNQNMISISEVQSEVATFNNGEFIVLTVTVKDFGTTKIAIQSSEIQNLINSLFAGSHLAYRARELVDAPLSPMTGIAAFQPTHYELGQVEDPTKCLALIRLKKGRLPVFDVVLDFDEARQFGLALLEHAEAGPVMPRDRH